MSGVRQTVARQIASNFAANKLGAMEAVWQLVRECEELDARFQRELPYGDALRTIDTALGASTDALCRTGDGHWAIIDQRGEIVIKAPTLITLARAMQPTADRIHRDRQAAMLRDARGKDHYAWRSAGGDK